MDARSRRAVGVSLAAVSVALTVAVATDTAPAMFLLAAVIALIGGVFLAT